jgi:hypothetical protein
MIKHQVNDSIRQKSGGKRYLCVPFYTVLYVLRLKALMAENNIRTFLHYPNIELQPKLMIGSVYKNNHSAYYPRYLSL